MMPRRMNKDQGLPCWILVTNACITVIILLDATNFVSGNVEIKPVDAQAANFSASHIVQYVLFSGSKNTNYNEARATCQAIGGDLAQIETEAKRDWIESLHETGSFFASHIWTGLTENVEGSPWWTYTCQPADPWPPISSGDWADNRRCFRLHNGVFDFDRRTCTEDNAFLCETYTEVTLSECDVNPNSTDSETADDYCVTTTTTTTTPTTTSTTTQMSSTQSTTTITTTTTTTSTTTTALPPTTTTSSITSTATSPTSSTTTNLTTSTATTPTTSTTTSSTSSRATTPTTSTTAVPTLTSTSPSTTVSTWSTTPVDDCGDCFCVLAANITIQEAQAIADQISKNLTVDAKSTSAHRRTLESAEDHRPSAKAVGFVGIIFIIIPFGVLILTDVRAMIQGAVNIRNVYKL